MPVGQGNALLALLPRAQGLHAPLKKRLPAGPHHVHPVLPVAHQRLVQEHNVPEGCGGQRDEPVVHVHAGGVGMLRHQSAQGGVHHQRAAGDVVLHQQPGQRHRRRIPALVAEEALLEQCAIRVHQAAVAVHQQGRVRSPAGLRLLKGLAAAGQAARLPLVILVAQGGVVPPGLADQADEVPLRAQMTAALLSRAETVIPLRHGRKQGRGAVGGAVVLHQHGEGGVILTSQGIQQRGQKALAVVDGQQHVDGLHQAQPHFLKNLIMDATWRRLPLRVRVFSRAQAWVTRMSG